MPDFRKNSAKSVTNITTGIILYTAVRPEIFIDGERMRINSAFVRMRIDNSRMTLVSLMRILYIFSNTNTNLYCHFYTTPKVYKLTFLLLLAGIEDIKVEIPLLSLLLLDHHVPAEREEKMEAKMMQLILTKFSIVKNRSVFFEEGKFAALGYNIL